MDGYNDYRAHRVLEVMADFEILSGNNAAIPREPQDPADRNEYGWVVLRQCRIESQRIAAWAYDTRVCSSKGGPEEQKRRELTKNLLDACSRRHEARRWYNCQYVCSRWLENRAAILQGERPQHRHRDYLRDADHRLRRELEAITDDSVYRSLRNTDINAGKWVDEDPSLGDVLTWLALRR